MIFINLRKSDLSDQSVQTDHELKKCAITVKNRRSATNSGKSYIRAFK